METGLPLIAGRPLRLQVIQLQDRNLAERNLPDYDLRKKECSSMDRLQFHGRTGELELLEGACRSRRAEMVIVYGRKGISATKAPRREAPGGSDALLALVVRGRGDRHRRR